MTSLLREEVSVPGAGWRSRRRVGGEEGWEARDCATARPTTPPPIMRWVKSARRGVVRENGRVVVRVRG
jgi:hypothetical protein